MRQKIKRVIWINLQYGQDLLGALSDFCLKNNIKNGFVAVIGALQRAKIAYYDQKKKKYLENSIEKPLEIVSCLGNISIKNKKPFLHLHIALADKKGKVFGGHLKEGCIIFAGEGAIFQTQGDLLERKFDKRTNLFLWNLSSSQKRRDFES